MVSKFVELRMQELPLRYTLFSVNLFQVEITKKFKKESFQIKLGLKSWQQLNLMRPKRRCLQTNPEVVSSNGDEAPTEDLRV